MSKLSDVQKKILAAAASRNLRRFDALTNPYQWRTVSGNDLTIDQLMRFDRKSSLVPILPLEHSS